MSGVSERPPWQEAGRLCAPTALAGRMIPRPDRTVTLDEILTVIRLGLPHELRRSLACTNIVENALGTVRQVTRNVKRWRHAEMALRWTAAGLLEAQKTFRRLKAYRQLPILRNALQEHLRKAQADSAIETIMKAA